MDRVDSLQYTGHPLEALQQGLYHSLDGSQLFMTGISFSGETGASDLNLITKIIDRNLYRSAASRTEPSRTEIDTSS